MVELLALEGLPALHHVILVLDLQSHFAHVMGLGCSEVGDRVEAELKALAIGAAGAHARLIAAPAIVRQHQAIAIEVVDIGHLVRFARKHGFDHHRAHRAALELRRASGTIRQRARPTPDQSFDRRVELGASLGIDASDRGGSGLASAEQQRAEQGQVRGAGHAGDSSAPGSRLPPRAQACGPTVFQLGFL